jgi:hypothetical protein
LNLFENEPFDGVDFYPVPCDDFLFIESSSNYMIADIEVVDVSGVRVFGKSMSGENKLDLSDLSSGLYVIIYRLSDGSVGQRRISKV